MSDDTPVTQTMMREEFELWRKNHKKEQEAEENGTKSKLDLLTGLMADEADEAAKRRKWGKWALGIVLGGGGISLGGYELVLKPPHVEPAEVKEAVTKEANALEVKVKSNTAKIERVGGMAITNQELTVETGNYIADKIDAAHPDKVGATEKPPELQQAEKDVKKRADEAKAGALFKDIDEALRASEAEKP